MAERFLPFNVPVDAPMSRRVHLARLAASLSPEDVAATIGISARSYYRAEKGTRPFARGELLLIALLTAQDPGLFDLPPLPTQ